MFGAETTAQFINQVMDQAVDPSPFCQKSFAVHSFRLVQVEMNVAVAKVAEGGPANSADVRAGDVVLEIDGDPVDQLAPMYRKIWALGAAGVATGHYARLSPAPDGQPGLYRARDREKDQTYFLFDVSRAALPSLAFPLGALRKSEVRTLAKERAAKIR